MATNNRIRFMANNFAELTTGNVTISSELASFPAVNAYQNKFRSKVWKPSGHFEITSSNRNLYFNDGADKIANITLGDYATPALLATQIQTNLNAISSGWTVSYDSAGSTYKFTIANSGNVTLRFSQTSNSIWDTLGYGLTTDTSGLSFEAEQQRNHTDEYIIFDLGYNATTEFFAIISPLDEIFSLSTDATIKLQANNVNDFSSPPLDQTLSRTDNGIYLFLDNITDTAYRFWKIEIIDKLNTAGPEGLSFGNIYLGTYLTIGNRNLGNAFTDTIIDPSQVSTSEDGSLFFDTKTKYNVFDSLNIKYLDKTDKLNLKQLYFDLGKTTPFYVSFDPNNLVSGSIDEFTKYVVFSSEPTFQHIKSDTFSIGFKLRELV